MPGVTDRDFVDAVAIQVCGGNRDRWQAVVAVDLVPSYDGHSVLTTGTVVSTVRRAWSDLRL